MIEIKTIGGYSEVGKNMTALKVDDEVVILDMGLYMSVVVSFDETAEKFGEKEMIKTGAIPDDSVIDKWKEKVVGICLGHAHLDHVGAVPYLAKKYGADIYGTPFTIEVLRKIIKDKGRKVPNKLKSINPNSKIKLSDKISVEFINMTHSTLQVAMMAVHTPYGVVLYANDFKFDNNPVLGKAPNYKRLEQLKGKVLCLIVDSLYSGLEVKTPSEKVAREMLEDVLLGTNNKGKAVIVTTFSSHLARIKSILDFGKKMKRKIVILGRSMNKYIGAAEKVNLVNFSKNAEIVGFGRKIRNKLKTLQNKRDQYLILVTGNQAEPGSGLDRMVNGAFKFKPEDNVIFSSSIIPDKVNVNNRERMEAKLRQKKVRIFTNIHVSGHCGREDLRDLVNMVKPKHIIPAHGDWDKVKPMAELAKEMGWKKDKIHLVHNGQKVVLG